TAAAAAAVPRRNDLGSGRPRLDPLEDRAQRVVVARVRPQLLGRELAPTRVACGEAWARAQSVDLAAIAQRESGGAAALDRGHRGLDRRRACVDDEQGLAQYFGPRRANTRATAQEATRVAGLSARLVSTMGTRAPSTMPADCASPRYSSCLASMLPDSRSGTTRTSACPATGDSTPLIFAASSEIALSNASGPSTIPPGICLRSAILHSPAAAIGETL